MTTLEAQLLKSIGTASATNSVSNVKIAVSSSGDLYVTGYFSGTLDIGGGVTPITTNSTSGSAFLAKYSSTLTPISLVYMSGTLITDYSYGFSISISSSNDVYVTGRFHGTLDIGGGVTPITTNTNSASAYVAKYSSTLTPASLVYMISTLSTDFSDGRSIDISSSNDVYVTGIFSGTLDIGGGVTPITTNSDGGSAYVAKYSSTLTPISIVYMSSTPSTDFSEGRSISISSSNDIYVTGRFTGTLNIGGGVTPITTNTNSASAFVAKYSSTLTPISLVYMISTLSTESSNGHSIAISSSNDVYVTGSFTGTLDIGGGVTPITTNSTVGSAYVARYSSTLTPASLVYMSTALSTDSSFVISISIPSSNDVYVTGTFTGTLDIGGGVTPITTNTITASAFLAKYNSTLTPASLSYIGGPLSTDRTSGTSISISSSGDVYVTGEFIGTLDIGSGVTPITNTSTNLSGYIAKYLTVPITTTTTTIPPTTTTTTTTTIPPTTTTTIPPTTTTTTTTTTIPPTTTTTTTTTTIPPTTTLPPTTTIPPTTTLPPTTTSTTTLPPNGFDEVEWAISAPFSLIDSKEKNDAYRAELLAKVVTVTGAPPNTVTIINLTPGSIVNTVRLPKIYVPPLQYAVQNGFFEITIDGVTYPAIASSFVILNNICFQRGTMILTPSGYRAVELLTRGDLVKTAQGRVTMIVGVNSFIGREDKCPLYVLHKGSLGANKPIMDLYMSEGHAYRNEGHWCHMKCSSVAMKLQEDNIEYYNMVLDNYLEHTLVANGVEVESLFKMPGLDMKWNCGTDNCKPIISIKK